MRYAVFAIAAVAFMIVGIVADDEKKSSKPRWGLREILALPIGLAYVAVVLFGRRKRRSGWLTKP